LVARTTCRGATRRAFLSALCGGVALLAVGCASSTEQPHTATSARSDLADYAGLPSGGKVTFPGYVSDSLKDAYQFAVDKPAVLRVLPCYCGCGLTSGHRSNLDCFIAGTRADGSVVFDDHASYCQTCLDIARDARALLAEGKSLKEIRATIDERHGGKGPGTDTPKPA
jgi:Protein of unknown function with PCYCGC motif